MTFEPLVLTMLGSDPRNVASLDRDGFRHSFRG